MVVDLGRPEMRVEGNSPVVPTSRARQRGEKIASPPLAEIVTRRPDSEVLATVRLQFKRHSGGVSRAKLASLTLQITTNHSVCSSCACDNERPFIVTFFLFNFKILSVSR